MLMYLGRRVSVIDRRETFSGQSMMHLKTTVLVMSWRRSAMVSQDYVQDFYLKWMGVV